MPSSMSARMSFARASSGRRGAGRRTASRRAGPPAAAPRRPPRPARGRCRGSRAQDARTPCGSRPTCPFRPAAAARGGPRAAADPGRRAGARPLTPAPPASIARTASSCSSLEAGSAGLPPRRATASATRSGWVVPIGSRSSPTAPSTTCPGSATARVRSRSTPAICSSKLSAASSASSADAGPCIASTRLPSRSPATSAPGASSARAPTAAATSSQVRSSAACGSARSAAGAGVTASSRPPSAAKATTHRPLAPRARQRELRAAVRELGGEQRAQLPRPLARRMGAAGVLERGGQVVHRCEPSGRSPANPAEPVRFASGRTFDANVACRGGAFRVTLPLA